MKHTNAYTIENELNWFSKVLENRMDLYFGRKSRKKSVFDISPPPVENDESVYAQLVRHYQLSFGERLALILALIPHVRPQLLDKFFQKNTLFERGFTEFGGLRSDTHSGFLPTGETLSFILAGNDLSIRFKLLEMFSATHVFAQHRVLELQTVAEGEPQLSGMLQIFDEYIELLTIGKASKPAFSSKFPAKLIATSQKWSDLVLENSVKQDINDIIAWITHKNTLLSEWNLAHKIKAGYRALFYGPPGTGKTFTACLMGKNTGKDVYRIDLSMIISKWVGETEKNLERVFAMAENKDWILFFDEADALFGKRTDTKSSQERYANQEVAYLLQRTEDYPGTVILASNLKGNLDEAFTRRFQSIVYFPMPKASERLLIWQNSFRDALKLDSSIDLKKIASMYEISGGGIVNVLKYCAIKAAERNERIVLEPDIQEGIKKELLKEGKVV